MSARNPLADFTGRHGAGTRINSFIETLNAALALLPEWATGEGGVRIGILDPVELGRIGNPFEGAATAAGAAAADAFSAALLRTYLEPPDLGLGAMADDARARANGYREAAGMLADAAGQPLASWQALKDAVTGTGTEAETALADAAGTADALTAGLNDTATAADGAGGAAREAGAAAAEGADTALTGWQAVTAALADYAAKARDIGGDIGSALVGAFQSAENAIGDFVKTGKLDFRDLVTSMIADLAKLAARRFILGPIANALSGALGGAGGIFANILHAGGMVGALGPGRMVPAMAFANASRMHNGGWAGLDPAAERDAGRKAITIKELAERFDKEHIAIRVKASTGKEYRRNLQRFILPALGQLTVTGVTRADVAKFHHDLRHIPYQANRCLEVISKMFSLSEIWGLRPDGTNPRKHIRKYPEEKRERFLSAAELRRIGEVLREMESEGVELPSAILAARLLILTGCRLNEIMSLKWPYVDLDFPALRLPDSKTGAKVVHVGQPVVDLLRDAQRIDGNPWVITGTLPGKPLSDLQPFWQRVRARAGVKDVRIHDLRHTFASTAVASGQGLPMIGKLLGHTQVQTTARYAHLAAEPVRMAADAVAQNLRQSLG